MRFAIALAAFLGLSTSAAGQVTYIRSNQSSNPQTAGHFGWAVSSVPDMDSDGHADVLIGARGEVGIVDAVARGGIAYVAGSNTGNIVISYGSPTSVVSGHFGQSVAGVPDLDGDGRGEVLVAAPGETVNGLARAGRVYVLSGITRNVLFVLTSPNAEADGDFGQSVAVGNVRRAGGVQFVVGAPGETVNGNADAGRVYVFSGQDGSLQETAEPNVFLSGARFGTSVAVLTRNGGPEVPVLAVGAPTSNGGRGAVHVYRNSVGPDWLDLIRVMTHTGAAEGLGYGFSVADMPDYDDNVWGDILLGAIGESTPAPGAGRAYLRDSNGGYVIRTIFTPAPEQDGYFGYSVAAVADIDGDGVDDMAIGAPNERAGTASQLGSVHLFSGATGGFLQTLLPPGGAAGTSFGISVAGIPGDSDGGRGRIVVGAPGARPGGVNAAGQAHIYRVGPAVATGDNPEVGHELAVVPNPASSSASRVDFHLARAGEVRLTLHDAVGRQVAVLARGGRAAGPNSVALDAAGLAPGLYLARLEVDGEVSATTRVTVTR